MLRVSPNVGAGSTGVPVGTGVIASSPGAGVLSGPGRAIIPSPMPKNKSNPFMKVRTASMKASMGLFGAGCPDTGPSRPVVVFAPVSPPAGERSRSRAICPPSSTVTVLVAFR